MHATVLRRTELVFNQGLPDEWRKTQKEETLSDVEVRYNLKVISDWLPAETNNVLGKTFVGPPIGWEGEWQGPWPTNNGSFTNFYTLNTLTITNPTVVLTNTWLQFQIDEAVKKALSDYIKTNGDVRLTNYLK